MTTKKVKAIFQLKVSLRDIEPSIWRSVQVAEDTKLPRLHRVLQLLFNWEDYHLHDFIVGRRVYSVPDPDDAFNERKVIDERHVPLNRIVDRVGDSFEYVYDFGDDLLLISLSGAPPPNGFLSLPARTQPVAHHGDLSRASGSPIQAWCSRR
ncbi:MAG TPA: plasmid pRiA4b ORF-3 family protein [Edaphobacter sp.]|nr:plasmid pRiA4b ORF-3 family protein [Edaphobacter sp.]